MNIDTKQIKMNKKRKINLNLEFFKEILAGLAWSG